ncbi:hypothetical protein TRIUR3_35138 [Triticum urartu]|uniref:Uncharacterized protein n=1 Tax=Triticum urartu TaxID=4572 RepID=M7YIY4_TRIUA|nr:hypothetical protein TRIUR3_35138 [Triticum urartu]
MVLGCGDGDGSATAPGRGDGDGSATTPERGDDGGGSATTPEHGDDAGGSATAPEHGDDGGGSAMVPEHGDDGGGSAMAPELCDDGGGSVMGPEHGDDGCAARGREQAPTLERDGDEGLALGKNGHDGEWGLVLESARGGGPHEPRRVGLAGPTIEPALRWLAREESPCRGARLYSVEHVYLEEGSGCSLLNRSMQFREQLTNQNSISDSMCHNTVLSFSGRAGDRNLSFRGLRNQIVTEKNTKTGCGSLSIWTTSPVCIRVCGERMRSGLIDVKTMIKSTF